MHCKQTPGFFGLLPHPFHPPITGKGRNKDSKQTTKTTDKHFHAAPPTRCGTAQPPQPDKKSMLEATIAKVGKNEIEWSPTATKPLSDDPGLDLCISVHSRSLGRKEKGDARCLAIRQAQGHQRRRALISLLFLCLSLAFIICCIPLPHPPTLWAGLLLLVLREWDGICHEGWSQPSAWPDGHVSTEVFFSFSSPRFISRFFFSRHTPRPLPCGSTNRSLRATFYLSLSLFISDPCRLVQACHSTWRAERAQYLVETNGYHSLETESGEDEWR